MSDVNETPTLPLDPPPTGTIDITATVESLRQSFVKWGVAYVYGLEETIPGLGAIVALPILDIIDKEIVEAVLNAISSSVIMIAFFTNTAIRKASQAQDFVNAVDALNNLPPTATDEEFANAEKNRMAAFRNFVMVTN